MNPFEPFLRTRGVVVLDGGLATTLEARGHDLADPLWSARVLLDAPEAVRAVHTDFLAAGADCVATVTYQATLPGFQARGIDRSRGEELLRSAARLAVEARDAFWADEAHRRGRLRPLVAGSIGPYGAFLADGSEYSGRYGRTREELYAFHEPRWRVLAESAVDLLACETIPSMPELEALLHLLHDSPGRWAWFSFQCRDGSHLADGTPLARAVAACDAAERVAAVGVNCVSPDLVPALVHTVARHTSRPVMAYPNSGETYDAGSKAWRGSPSILANAAASWIAAGAAVVGGCCRVDPAAISAVRRAVVGSPAGDGPERRPPGSRIQPERRSSR